MLLSEIKLQYLESFKLVASQGSLKHAAEETGVSKSTISYHLKSLEEQMSVELLDHSHRPMRLTVAGKIFLRYVDEVLAALRKAEADITMADVVNIRSLRMAQTHEFDSDIAPTLAVFLATRMPKCEFSMHARSSNEILYMLEHRMLDLGIGSRPATLPEGIEEYRLLNDPFVLALPVNSQASPEDLLKGKVNLPFLRFNKDQLMGTQINNQLRRLRISLPSRFEFESHQSMMAVVAEGLGWTITTPLGFTRAQRFQKTVRLCAFPNAAFSRTFSLFVTREHSPKVAKIVARTFRSIITRQFIEPMLEQQPWLTGSLYALDD